MNWDEYEQEVSQALGISNKEAEKSQEVEYVSIFDLGEKLSQQNEFKRSGCRFY